MRMAMDRTDLFGWFKRQSALYRYVYIYGAGFRAKVLTGMLLSETKDICISGIVITDRQSAKIDFCWELPIVELQEIDTPNEETLFLIGTVDAYVKEICRELQKRDYTNYIHVPEKEFQELKHRYAEKQYEAYFGEYLQKNLCKGTVQKNDPVIKIYMVKSEKDRSVKLQARHPNIIPIQGGREISDRKIAELGDNTGRNISQKNRQFNEFTVIYWLWKNAARDSEYIGLCHYRRIFDMDHALDRIKSERPDVVLVEPEVLFPTIETHYCSIHYAEDFLLMKAALRKRYPEYAVFAEKYFSQELFIPYNMMIAKSAVFVEYAEWIFPLLEEIEEKWRPRGHSYEDRALAFLGEWLTGVYFLYHRNRLRLTYSKIQLLEMR